MGNKRVLIAGGGTGGHIYPAIAVAGEIKRQVPEVEVVLAGRPGSMEQRVYSEKGYPMVFINTAGFQRREWLRNLKTPFVLIRAILKSRSILREYSPAVVIGTGGYVSAPVVFGAWTRGIPAVILEQNSIPGITTRALSHFARTAFLAYEESIELISGKIEKFVLGNPIREPVKKDKKELRKKYGLDPQSQLLLVFGGSQGAKALNIKVTEMVQGFCSKTGREMIWQTGPLDFEEISGRFAEKATIHVHKFLDPIYDYYSMADLVIARAGAISLSEITAFGLPAILVPLPTAADDHQRINARVLEKKGAAVVVEQQGPSLGPAVEDILGNSGKLSEMAKQSAECSRPSASKDIVGIIRERWLK
jgi:UDP-N-acetylglucosamine--N-acetylmuramyl-(pentapeptide) pyrophosphoryl-undecaprenol N-acetylglucosamine transferase